LPSFSGAATWLLLRVSIAPTWPRTQGARGRAGTVLDLPAPARVRLHRSPRSPSAAMHPFVILGILLLIVWAVLWLGFKIVSGLVHLIVVIAVVLVVWGLLKRGARAVKSRL
jgi:Flp pilus assembly protein TadB